MLWHGGRSRKRPRPLAVLLHEEGERSEEKEGEGEVEQRVAAREQVVVGGEEDEEEDGELPTREGAREGARVYYVRWVGIQGGALLVDARPRVLEKGQAGRCCHSGVGARYQQTQYRRRAPASLR